MKINDLKIATLFSQVHIFASAMDTLIHICKSVVTIAAQGWAFRGSVSTETVVGPILRDLALLSRTYKIHSSVLRIAGTDNKMANAASCIIHLTNKMYLRHFALTFTQIKPCQMITLSSGYKRYLTSTLHSQRSRMDFLT